MYTAPARVRQKIYKMIIVHAYSALLRGDGIGTLQICITNAPINIQDSG